MSDVLNLLVDYHRYLPVILDSDTVSAKQYEYRDS